MNKTLKFILSFVKPQKQYKVTRTWFVYADSATHAISKTKFTFHDKVWAKKVTKC